MRTIEIKPYSKAAEHTKTLENTPENIKMLENKGYKKSPISKPNGMYKVLRYNHLRGVYWLSSSRSSHESDCFFTRQRVGIIYTF